MLFFRRVAVVLGCLLCAPLVPACRVPECMSNDTTELRRAVLVLATRDMRCSADQITMTSMKLVGKIQGNVVTRGCGLEAAYQCDYQNAACRITDANCTYRGCAKDGILVTPDQPFCP